MHSCKTTGREQNSAFSGWKGSFNVTRALTRTTQVSWQNLLPRATPARFHRISRNLVTWNGICLIAEFITHASLGRYVWYLTVKANTKVSRPMICCTIALMEQTLCLQSWRASDRRELHSWRSLNQCFLKSSCCWYYVCSLAMVAQWQSGKWPWRIPDGCALIWSCLLSNVPILPCAGQPKTPMGTSLRQLWAQLRTMFT